MFGLIRRAYDWLSGNNKRKLGDDQDNSDAESNGSNGEGRVYKKGKKNEEDEEVRRKEGQMKMM